ncbi:MAG: hypothetical protein CSA39_05745 [Flavobacteriales bacterium]|nr:MAG: hypothetical protein CSA39_05745 [Flavobacteriales bacterium]
MNDIFSTQRLKVRKLNNNDLHDFHRLHSNKKVMQFVSPTVYTIEQSKNEIPKLIKNYDNGSDSIVYAVERIRDGVFIGTVALIKDAYGNDEIGYKIDKVYWNSGYGTELASGLINYCKTIGLSKIVAYVAQKNTASIKIIKKAGFQFLNEVLSNDLNITEYKYQLYL